MMATTIRMPLRTSQDAPHFHSATDDPSGYAEEVEVLCRSCQRTSDTEFIKYAIYYTDEESWNTWSDIRDTLDDPKSWQEFKTAICGLYPQYEHAQVHTPLPVSFPQVPASAVCPPTLTLEALEEVSLPPAAPVTPSSPQTPAPALTLSLATLNTLLLSAPSNMPEAPVLPQLSPATAPLSPIPVMPLLPPALPKPPDAPVAPSPKSPPFACTLLPLPPPTHDLLLLSRPPESSPPMSPVPLPSTLLAAHVTPACVPLLRPLPMPDDLLLLTDVEAFRVSQEGLAPTLAVTRIVALSHMPSLDLSLPLPQLIAPPRPQQAPSAPTSPLTTVAASVPQTQPAPADAALPLLPCVRSELPFVAQPLATFPVASPPPTPDDKAFCLPQGGPAVTPVFASAWNTPPALPAESASLPTLAPPVPQPTLITPALLTAASLPRTPLVAIAALAPLQPRPPAPPVPPIVLAIPSLPTPVQAPPVRPLPLPDGSLPPSSDDSFGVSRGGSALALAACVAPAHVPLLRPLPIAPPCPQQAPPAPTEAALPLLPRAWLAPLVQVCSSPISMESPYDGPLLAPPKVAAPATELPPPACAPRLLPWPDADGSLRNAMGTTPVVPPGAPGHNVTPAGAASIQSPAPCLLPPAQALLPHLPVLPGPPCISAVIPCLRPLPPFSCPSFRLCPPVPATPSPPPARVPTRSLPLPSIATFSMPVVPQGTSDSAAKPTTTASPAPFIQKPVAMVAPANVSLNAIVDACASLRGIMRRIQEVFQVF